MCFETRILLTRRQPSVLIQTAVVRMVIGEIPRSGGRRTMFTVSSTWKRLIRPVALSSAPPREQII